MSILLDDKEIREATRSINAEMVNKIMDGTAYDKVYPEDRAIVKATAKKIVDIIKRDCPETLFLLEDLKFWHDLLGEIE